MESFSSSVSTVPSFEDHFTHNMWNPLLELLFHEKISGVSNPLLMKLTWPRSHSLVILNLIHSAAKKVRMTLHDAVLGTFVHLNIFVLVWHHCHPCDIELFELWVPGSLPLSPTAVT